MTVGITYDLKEDHLREGVSEEDAAEFDSPATIEAIETTLQALGFRTERIGHLRALLARLAAGGRWDMVFNIAEGVHGIGREAQVPAVLDAFQIPYTFSDTVVLALCLHKGLTKSVVRDAGVPTPDFAVVERASDAAAVRLGFPVFAKPVAEGTGKGITGASRAGSPAQLQRVCAELLRRFQQPVLVEAFLPGRELTVGVLGTGAEARAIGALEIQLGGKAEAGAYTYHNKKHYEDRVSYAVASDEVGRKAEAVALAAWRALGCRDGGRVDLRADAQGRVRVLEINPLAGINPVISDLPILCYKVGVTYQQLIDWIFESACKRCGLTPPPRRSTREPPP
jgi:D-alanine-D-alanine ligase